MFTEVSFGIIEDTAMFMSFVLTKSLTETVDKSIGLKSSFSSPPVDIAEDPMNFSVLSVF